MHEPETSLTRRHRRNRIRREASSRSLPRKNTCIAETDTSASLCISLTSFALILKTHLDNECYNDDHSIKEMQP